MKRPTESQLRIAAGALGKAAKRWKLIAGGHEALVFEFPAGSTNSPPDGEPCRFWRFTDKHEAERFRDRKVLDTVSETLAENGVF